MTDAPGITLSRKFPIPAADLYDAWTDPAQVVEWYGCGYEGVSWKFHKWNAEEGGELLVDLFEGANKLLTIEGRFLVADRPRRLVYTWHADEQIHVDLVETPEGTKLTLTHTNLPIERTEVVNGGWTAALTALGDTQAVTRPV